jgi:hypothetical protein
MQWIVLVVKLILMIMNVWTESSKEKKAKKEAALKEVLNGISANDNSKITAGFDSFNSI